ncbi:hypothetical protein EST38_g4723 [Candolleomyces aberdarensis]|uniref:Uncharacterized protein n=1 Tax=Candolleomyces aberdarensis TaxID=2316362 RepID=A0A4Q2DQ85_9AGAR|nr:hypothetical protein EST38_g4723 [Candolleomyces aberdarensis]
MFAEQSDAFPKPEDVMNTESVELSDEDSTTLRLLFIFMHSKELMNLAQAAQKYLLLNLVAFCRLAIEARVKDVPIDAFIYATKNELSALADIAAPYMVAESLKPSHTGQISGIGSPLVGRRFPKLSCWPGITSATIIFV